MTETVLLFVLVIVLPKPFQFATAQNILTTCKKR